MTNLYDLAREIHELEEAFDRQSINGESEEISDEDFFERLSQIEMDGDAKAQNIVAWIISCDVEAGSIGTEIARLTARKRARERQGDRLRRYLSDWLRSTGKRKLKTILATATLSRGRESVKVDVRRVPEWPLEIVELLKDSGALSEEILVRSSEMRKVLPELWRDLPGVELVEGDEILTIR